MQNLIVITKEPVHRLPPLISLLASLSELGHNVTLLTSSCTRENLEYFKCMGVNVIELFPQFDARRKSNSINKLKTWLIFRRNVRGYLADHKKEIIWVAGGDTMLALGSGLDKMPYILQLFELYDTNPLYRIMLEKYARRAVCVIVPEECRAAIFRVWYGLEHAPFVIFNKTHYLKPFDSAALGTRNMDLLEQIKEEKLVLYQARMVRMDLLSIARAIDCIDGYVLGVMGDIRDKVMFQKLKSECKKLVHFDYIPAPDHLCVTSRSHIGVLLYNYESLNNIFCAPNKIWEYSQFAIPVISNRLPMIAQQLEQHRMGESFEWTDVDEICRAIKRIDSDYEGYKVGAKQFYNSFNMTARVSEILESFNKRKESYKCWIK